MKALEIKNLKKTYNNDVTALKGIDLSVDKGDFKEFHKQGNWIGGLSTVYGNLCKK